MTRNDAQLKLRLPHSLLDRIRKSAFENRRSITSETVVLLERALPVKTNASRAKEGEAV